MVRPPLPHPKGGTYPSLSRPSGGCWGVVFLPQAVGPRLRRYGPSGPVGRVSNHGNHINQLNHSSDIPHTASPVETHGRASPLRIAQSPETKFGLSQRAAYPSPGQRPGCLALICRPYRAQDGMVVLPRALPVGWGMPPLQGSNPRHASRPRHVAVPHL
jgi:hypothetical protein